MTAAALPPAALPRLGSLLRLLASDQDGEVVGAARAIGRVLAGFGLTLHDLAAAVERPAAEPFASARDGGGQRCHRPGDVDLDHVQRRVVAEALQRGLAGGRMTEWEHRFAGSILERLRCGQGRLSVRQAEALGRLLEKVGEDGAWA